MSFDLFKRVAQAMLVVLAFVIISRLSLRPEQVVQTAMLTYSVPPKLDEFGFSDRAFVHSSDTLRKGERLRDVFVRSGLTVNAAVRLEEAAREVIDTRRVRAGQTLEVYRAEGRVSHFVYEEGRRHFVVMTPGILPVVKRHEWPISVETRAVQGVVNSSLYDTLDRMGVDGELGSEIAKIFGWKVDFHRLRKGDRLSLVLEERRVKGVRVGQPTILAARMLHAGKEHQAFRFEQEGKAEYFDEEGRSLRQAFLKSPLKFSRMSSGFSMNRFHPVQQVWKPHLGTDYAAPTGTPILSVGDGVVLEAAFSGGNGNYVKIKHNATYTTQYLHMSRIGPGIKPGVRVGQGQVIGFVGSTGLATGPHVCFRFWKNGVQVDHRTEQMPSADPVRTEYRAMFEADRNFLQDQLGGPTLRELLTPVFALDLPLYAEAS